MKLKAIYRENQMLTIYIDGTIKAAQSGAAFGAGQCRLDDKTATYVIELIV